VPEDLSQYLEIFAQESREHLLLLNQNLLKFEQDTGDLFSIHELFRSAHTLKGMSATMGFEDLAELTHCMENLMSLVRQTPGLASEELIEMLFGSLDALESLLDEHVNGKGHEVNIQQLVQQLTSHTESLAASAQRIGTGRAAQGQAKPIAAPASDASLADPGCLADMARIFEISPRQISMLEDILQSGMQAIYVEVRLRPDCQLKAARVYMVHHTLEERGDIVFISPSVEAIESEEFDSTVRYMTVSHNTEQSVRESLAQISELESFRVGVVRMPDKPGSALPKVQPQDGSASAISESGEELEDIFHQGRPKLRQARTIRVDTAKLDHLLNLAGELTIEKCRLQQLAGSFGNPQLDEGLLQFTAVLTQLQRVVLQTRLEPVETVFNRFPRMIRDLARSRGKQIRFDIRGAATEMDRTVIDEIGDPLVHLIRNAIDHGLETPDERLAAGKKPEGHLALAAFHEGASVVIQITDDGRGIDPNRIRQRAARLGLLSPLELAELSDRDVCGLIFTPGFSTAERVTDISGRGVGMDAVQSRIDHLAGTVQVDSLPGRGTTVSIRLPLSMAIEQVQLLAIAGQVYAIRLACVEEVFTLAAADVLGHGPDRSCVLRNESLPLLWMRELLGEAGADQELSHAVVVVNSGRRRIGLVVDGALEQLEIVVRSLGSFLAYTPLLAGGSILDDGRIALLLDPAQLATRVPAESSGAA
jgi:two-component system chemotaxis sensor kinase CheA